MIVVNIWEVSLVVTLKIPNSLNYFRMGDKRCEEFLKKKLQACES